MTRIRLSAVILFLAIILLAPFSARSAVVGQFLMVTGETDVLKQGKPPGLPVKINDGVEPGDVVRTKSNSKAQIRFVDDSTLTMAPDSRVAVADYLYDQSRGERRAVLRVFKGLVHTVVTRILNVQKPEFLMGTHTAVLGVRGTEWYTLLTPNSTGAFLIQGLLDVNSNLPSLPAVRRLKSMEFTWVYRVQQPQVTRRLTPDMLTLLRKMMDTGIKDSLLLECGISPEACIPGGVPYKMPTGLEGLPQPSIPPTLKQPVVPVQPAAPPTVTPVVPVQPAAPPSVTPLR